MRGFGEWLVWPLGVALALMLGGCQVGGGGGHRDQGFDRGGADGSVLDAALDEGVQPRPDGTTALDLGPRPDGDLPDGDTPDGTMTGDARPLDEGPTPDGGLDGGPDAELDGGTPSDLGPRPDADVLPDGDTSEPAVAPEVLRRGEGGFLLRGAAVLTPEGPLFNAEVLIIDTDIRCVGHNCADDPAAANVTVIDTHGVIAPGLIDTHNHLTYNFLEEWAPEPAQLFDSRYQWRGNDQYRAHVQPESAGGSRGDFVCPATKWAELRSIIHGTTTVQGQSPNQACAGRLSRNADHGGELGPDRVRTSISGPCEAGLNDAARVSLVSDFVSGDTNRFFVHMAEGVTGNGQAANVLREFECYAGTFRSTTSLLRDANGVPYETAVFIHAITLTEDQLLESAATHARFVWSPSSNLLLYGQTAPIERMLELGLTVGLGPDWTVSGSDELLTEMRFALAWAAAEAIDVITPQVLVKMATSEGADVVGQETRIGKLVPGFRADIAVFGRVAQDPYQAVTDSGAADVRLVMIDGKGLYGDADLAAAAAVNEQCEALDACGHMKFVCAANTPGDASRAGETVADIEAQLLAHLAAQGRNDLLPLVDCSQPGNRGP